MYRGWELPDFGWVKLNVHAVYYNQPLANGNRSGVGAVLRDHEGEILLMVSGSIPRVNPRANELLSMSLGLRCAYYKDKHNVVLETEHEDAYNEWENWKWFVDDRHRSVVDQLNQRKKDKRLKLQVSIVRESQNMLARYLAEDGALNRTAPVLFRRNFGRVRELWHLDMGLGWVGEGFDLVEEDQYLQQQQLVVGLEGMGEHDNEHAEDSGSAAVVAAGV